MIVRSCLARRPAQTYHRHIQPFYNTILARNFHQTSRLKDDQGLPNHYETLDVPTNASPNEIKKQFYKLSKSHHPDLHPNDPTASQKFVQISEAYAVLGSPEKRSRYDRDFLRTQQQHATSNTPKGSFSSAASPAGGRPASGLSRRRTQFRGPPPSFYRSGGYGGFSEKRSDAARNASHTYETQGQAQSGPKGGQAGMGPGGYAQGFDNDVPHFDQRGHYQTHNDIEKTRHKARRRRDPRIHEAELEQGSSSAGSFFMVSGVIVLILAGPTAFAAVFNGDGRRKEKNG